MLSSIETPKANPEKALAIIEAAYNGKVVVPEFQRSFVWERGDVEELLMSVLQGYFIGTFLLLDTPTDSPMFPFRAVEGLEDVNPTAQPRNHQTVRLVLDGQQRITSLFYAFYGPNIPLKGAHNPHKFYLRLEPALEGDIEKAVEGISTYDRRRHAEMERLVSAGRALPFPILCNSSSFHQWLYRSQQTWDEGSHTALEELHERMTQFMVPIIALSPEAGKDNIINIFERINRTGVGLSLFDLAGARLYMKNIRLRDLWHEFEHAQPAVADAVKPEWLLKVIALFHGKEPRKGNLLDVLDTLDRDHFLNSWQAAIAALGKAHVRMTQEYGAARPDWVPYTTLIVPLAALLHRFAEMKAGAEAYRKLDRWYWGNVFSQRYDSAVDTKSYQDGRDVQRGVQGGDAPDWLARLSADDVDLDVNEPRSALFRGLMCLMVKRGARDFLTGQPANLSSEGQDDHIFPQAVYKKHFPVDTILNRAPLIHSNQRKLDKHPAQFMQMCLHEHGGSESRLLATLATHFITEDGYIALLDEDFNAFIAERRKALGTAVQRVLATGTIDGIAGE